MALARRNRTNLDIWPGFVDALATLLMVIIFLLMIFVISQVYLNEALVGRDEALEKLNRQIADIAEQLSLEQSANEDLRSNIESLSTQLRASLAERDELQASLGALRIERNSVLARLDAAENAANDIRADLQDKESRLADSDALLSRTRQELEDAYSVVEANKETIELQLKELDTLAEDVNALTALRRELLQQVADLEALSEKQKEELGQQAKTIESQTAEIGEQAEDLQSKTEELALRAARLAALEKALEEKEAEIETMEDAARSNLKEIDAKTEAVLLARAESARLREQIAALNEQIAALNQTLDASEARDKEQKAQIVDLGKRLNLALASKVQELARYRSEFFGRLREILGNRQDVRVVGDRFVFQSEVLFAQGSAELGPAGQEQLGQLADTLIQISRDIPSEINWVLRVDGHTDSVPISTARFPSNWELSTARAISVVKFLENRGIPSERLAATGFAEFQPLDEGDDEIAYRRNRRIELKLTER